jgi:hypothetical protein
MHFHRLVLNTLIMGSLCQVAVCCAADARGQGRPVNSAEGRLWSPVADEVCLQEIGSRIQTTEPVTALASLQGTLYAVVGGEVRFLKEGHLQSAEGAPKQIRRLRSLADRIWASSANGTFAFDGQKWVQLGTEAFVDFCLHLGQVHGATADQVFRFENGKFVNIKPEGGYLSTDTTLVAEDYSQVLSEPIQIGPIERLDSYSGTIYLLGGGKISLLEGRTYVPTPVDWGGLPSRVHRDLLRQGSRLYVATDRGLGVLRGMAMTRLGGSEGLPFEDTTCLAPGFDGDLWIGTSVGAIRKTGDAFHYFGAQHWLPGDYVRDIHVMGRTVYVATDAGLATIRYEPFTLLKKSAWFERELRDWGFKRLGFIHKLFWSQEENGWLREISDNDGGNTAPYLAAMSFKFAATGDEEARKEAVEAFKAMVWLDDITGKPGFIARAVWSEKGDKGERAKYGSGGLPAKWYPTADGLWYWKGDTSSDEVNAHFFAVSLFHDLAAQGAEKQRAARHIVNISSHIMTNGWVLRDMDGKPTRWGRWDPEYLQRPYGFESRGLNGMEAQTYMQTAYALTGDVKFQEGLQQLIQWRYHTYTVRQRITFPPDQIAIWDDELSFFCYFPLLTYSKDPELRSIYLRSLERTWEVLRIQQLPFYNFTYGALTGNDCEIPEAVRHLREWSLDLINYSFHNSHRSDLKTPSGYVPYSGGTRAISPREMEARWGARNSLEYDGGEGGKAVTPPTGWLLDYWMGRYYGFIEAPTATNLAFTKISPRVEGPKGATPYNGPPRP